MKVWRGQKRSGIRDLKMITELLKVKLINLSFDLAFQKCLFIEQANKDVQVLQGEQGPGTQINKLDTVKLGKNKLHPNHHQRQRDPGVRTPRSLNLTCPSMKERCYHYGIIGHTQQTLARAKPPNK